MVQKILLVDDDLELCDMLRLHLEQAGFEVVMHDGASPLSERDQFDIVMPICTPSFSEQLHKQGASLKAHYEYFLSKANNHTIQLLPLRFSG